MARKEEKKKGRSIREKVRAKASEVSSNLNLKGKLFVPKAETYKIVILPYEVKERQPEANKGELWYRRIYWRHGNIGPEGDRKTYNCPKSVFKPCPICEDLMILREDYDENKKIIDPIKQKKRELYNIVMYDDLKKVLAGKMKLKEAIQILEISWFCFGKKLEEEIRESEIEEGYDQFADCINGKILKIRFAEMDLPAKKGKDIPVEVSRIDFFDREDLDEDEVLESVYNLDDLLNIPSYDQLNKSYKELEDPEEEEDEKPKSKKSSSKKVPKLEEEEEEEIKVEEDDLDGMDRAKLKSIIKNEELDIVVTKKMSDDDIRSKIKELRSPIEEEEEEEEPEEEPEEEELEEENDGLDELDRAELKSIIKKEELNITVTKKMTDDDLRSKIRELQSSIEEDPEEELEEEEEEKPKEKSKSNKGGKSSSKGGCPHGLEYGKDCGKKDECDECDKFDSCMDLNLSLKKKK